MALRHCRCCGDWHSLEKPWPHNCISHFGAPPERSHLPAPMQIRDCMDHVLNHAEGRMYDSQRAYEKAVRAAGCEIVGNENLAKHITPYEAPRDVGSDIKRAIAELS